MRGLRSAAVAVAAFALCPVVVAQQTQPIGSAAEQRREERARAENPGKSDWEREQEAREFKEGEVVLPPLPGDGLIEFPVSAATSFRFFIDPKSISVGAEGLVRYTLVARSPSGVRNISYEGIRCGGQGVVRVYAFSTGDKWSRNTTSEWRPIEPRGVQRWHSVLRSNYFCPARFYIQSAEEGVDALRRGGHPQAANLGAGGGS